MAAEFNTNLFPFNTMIHKITIKLSSSNYLLWKSQLLPLLESQELLGHVDGTLLPPPQFEPPDSQIQNVTFLAWKITDQRLLSLLLSSLTEEAMAEVVGLSTSREVWLALENTFSQRSKAHEIRLKDELQSMKRGTRSVAEYSRAFKALCDQLHAIGRPIDETDKAHWFLQGLGAIPPPAKASHRRGRGRRGCNPFCSCCECLAGCIFNCIFQIILTLIVVLGVIALVLWLVFRPNTVKFYATDARLTRFDYSNTTLYYDMALNMTVRNPNRRLGIYYDNIEARTFYEGQRFATNTLTPFYQGHKNTTDLRTDFNGQHIVLLGSSAVDNYNGQKSSGRYDVDVKLYLRVRFKWGIIKSWRFRPKIKCELKVPLQSITGSNSAPFETTRCHFDW